jgi:hypothetical protein
MIEPQLRALDSTLRALVAAGLPEQRGIQLLRAIVAYAFGYALAELTWLAPPTCPNPTRPRTAGGVAAHHRRRTRRGTRPAGPGRSAHVHRLRHGRAVQPSVST